MRFEYTESAATRPDEPSDRTVQILQERARRLAQGQAGEESAPLCPILLFHLRHEEYAVALRALHSVQRPDGLTPVPCTPSHIAGIMNVRGEVITVVDLAAAMVLDEGHTPAERAQVLLVQRAEGPIGLLVDGVIGIHEAALDQLAPSLSGNNFTLGIYQGTTVVLDLEHLLTAERLDVFEHVG